jgi:hypothetical protein
MNVEQGCDDLQVVLHPVMDLANEPPLSVESAGHLTFRLLDPLEGPGKGVPQFLDFRRWAELAGQSGGTLPWLEASDRAFELAQRADQQARDQEPGDQCRHHPH